MYSSPKHRLLHNGWSIIYSVMCNLYRHDAGGLMYSLQFTELFLYFVNVCTRDFFKLPSVVPLTGLIFSLVYGACICLFVVI